MKRKSISVRELGFDLINYIILTLFFIITIYPFYYIFIYSISDSNLAQKGISLLPAGISLEGYKNVFQLKNMINSLGISFSRTVLGTALTVLCCIFCAYIVTKRQLLFRKAIYRFIVITMYFNAGFIPYYLTMRAYGLRNNFLLYIIPSAISAYYIILMKTFIEQLPPSLEESAKIDGAGYLAIFVKIIFPLCKPILATIAVFAAVAQWNSWFDNFLLVENPRLKTLQLVLYEYLNQSNAIALKSSEELSQAQTLGQPVITPRSIKMTITMVVTLPILFVYPFAQRFFVKGIMLGAIKG